MVDPTSIIGGIATGIAAEQSNRFIRQLAPEDISNQDLHHVLIKMEELLQLIAEGNLIAPAENDTILIQPYPYEFRVPQYSRLHFCLFLPSGMVGTQNAYNGAITTAKLLFQIPGIGNHIKSVSPGWTQLDLPPSTRISSADGLNYPALTSFRNDPLGVAL